MNAAYAKAVDTNVLTIIKGGKKERTNSALKSDGKPKATAADPIRDIADVHELQNYFREKGQLRNYLLVTLGISFALRAGDLLSIRLMDVYGANWEVKKEFYLYEDKTNKRNRIHINSVSKQALEEYRGMIKAEKPDTTPLFASRKRDADGNCRAITIQHLNHILAEARKEIGIEDHISSHTFRKTHAYHMIKESNYDSQVLYALQHGFNHSDIRVTMIYSGIEDDMVDEVKERMGSLLI